MKEVLPFVAAQQLVAAKLTAAEAHKNADRWDAQIVVVAGPWWARIVVVAVPWCAQIAVVVVAGEGVAAGRAVALSLLKLLDVPLAAAQQMARFGYKQWRGEEEGEGMENMAQ